MKTKDILVSFLLLLATAISLRAWPMESAGESAEETRLQRPSSTTGEHADGARGTHAQADQSTFAARATTLAVSENEATAVDEAVSIPVAAEEINIAIPLRTHQNEMRLPSAAVNLDQLAPLISESAIAAPEHISMAMLVDMGADESTIRAALAANGVTEAELQAQRPFIQDIMGNILADLYNAREREEERAAISQAEAVRIMSTRILSGKEAAEREAAEWAIVWEAVRAARAVERERAEQARLKAERAAQADAERIAQYKAEYNSPAARQAQEEALAKEIQARNERTRALETVAPDILNRTKEGAQRAALGGIVLNETPRRKNAALTAISSIEAALENRRLALIASVPHNGSGVGHQILGSSFSFLPASLQRALAGTKGASEELAISPLANPEIRNSITRAQSSFIDQVVNKALQSQAKEAARVRELAAFESQQKAATDAARAPYHEYFATNPSANQNNSADRAAARVYGKAAYDESMSKKK